MHKKFIKILDSEMTVNQKINAIMKEIDDIKEQGYKLVKELEEGTEFCPKCKEYYKKSAWNEEIKMEMHNICTYWPLAEFDEPEYADVNCRIQYRTCPCGHIFTKNLDARH